jgi:glutathione S-transferase
MLELYHAGLTSCPKKVRHCLHEKGLHYQSRFVDLMRFEHHDPAYLALNPNGVVPTLVHDGAVVIESGVINEYLDEVFPDLPLRPEAPRPGRACGCSRKMADEYGLQATRAPTWTRLKSFPRVFRSEFSGPVGKRFSRRNGGSNSTNLVRCPRLS